MDDVSQDDELDSTILIAIVIGSTGFLLMVLGGAYYLSRLGDVPSRKSVANDIPPSVGARSTGYVIE